METCIERQRDKEKYSRAPRKSDRKINQKNNKR